MFKVKYINNKFEYQDLEIEFFKFPAGELHFRVLTENRNFNKILIITDLRNSDEIMKMILVSDFYNDKIKKLSLSYMPYSRQDRVTANNEPFSLKTMCKLINLCNFKAVALSDPHSDVAPALIDNIKVVDRSEMVDLQPLIDKGYDLVIISPDAGAMKTNHKIAMKYNIPHVCAQKIRDLKTGQIIRTEINSHINLDGKHLYILDDMCDGGRTFIELAKAIKKKYYAVSSISLSVTVGIFSKGLDELNKYFNTISYSYSFLDEQ